MHAARLYGLLGFMIAALSATAAPAASLLYDGFGTSAAPAPSDQYQDAAALGAQTGQGTGSWTANWTVTGSVTTTLGSLSAANASDDPGRVLAATGGATVVRTHNATAFTALGNEVWFSYIFERVSGTNNTSFRIADSSSRYFGVSLDNTPTAPSELRADIRFAGSTVERSTGFAAVTAGNIYFVIGRFVFNPTGNDRLDVWVNPASVASVVAMGTPTMFIETANSYSVFDEIRIANGSAASYAYDEIHVGGALADVAVPEPASLALLLLGGILMLGRGRKAPADEPADSR